MKILIIEDEEPIRQTLQDLLELNGHTVMAAACGEEGLQLAEREPGLILCDINMPGINGYQVLSALQQNPRTHAIPFIFLTALVDRAAQRRGMELGANDFITKPFSERDILAAIDASVRRQQSLRQRIEALLFERRIEAGADWSHELMTPLNGVLGGLQLIEAEADTIKPGELKDLLGLIRAGAARQQALSNKLVRYFELERLRAALPGKRANCDAPESISAGANSGAQQENRVGDVTVRCEAAKLPVAEAHLISAVVELVSNACRFSKPGQPVTVSGTQRDGRYRITVTDEGVGMTAEQCATAGPFRQFDRSRYNQQGLGLGIAIARATAELGGGSLRLEPGPGGRGLQAVLDLPCA